MSKADVRQQLGLHVAKNTAEEKATLDELLAAFERSGLPLAQRFQAFARHIRRQDIARFLTK